MPSNGRGLHPLVDGSTLAHWSFDDTAVGAAPDTVGNARPLSQVAAIALPALGTGRIGRERQFTGTQLLGRAATAADMTFAQGEWTISVWTRILAFPTATNEADVIVCLGGRDGVDGGTPDDNIQFCVEMVKLSSVVPFPGNNGEVRPRLFWEDGNGTNRVVTVSSVDLRRSAGQWILFTWRKTTGSPFTYDFFFNGRLVETFTGQVNSSSGALTNQRWTVGGLVNSVGTGASRGFTGRVCSWHAQVGGLANSEIEEMWRRGAGLSLPTAQRVRLFVEDQSAVFRDLTDPDDVGDDFVESVELSDGIDDQAEQMTATLFRESGDLSVAPFRGDSFLNNPTLAASFVPLVDLWRPVRLEHARVPHWIEPGAGDWQNRFEGRIDEIDDGGERLVVVCRDQGGRLAERYISTEKVYPQPADLNTNGCGATAGGRETVLQRIVDDNGGVGVFGPFATIHTPVPSQSCMLPMQQPLPRGHLLPTLRTLAGHIGWECRSRWDPSTDSHRLTFFDPGRGRVDADAVISPREVIRQPGGRIDASGVRNVVTVTFPDRVTAGFRSDRGLALPNNVLVSDAGSITQFDERRMEVIEDQSSQIDTPTEATRMAQAIVDDLSQPRRGTSHELNGVPELDIHDLCLFQPDFLRTTVNQEGAVRSLTHSFSREAVRTQVSAEGKPAAGFNRWLSVEAGRNGRPPIRDPGEALTGRGIGTLLPGLLDIVDRSIYLGGIKYVEAKNGEFARFSRGTLYPPDAWSMRAGVWGTDIFATTTGVSSGFALQLANTTGQIVSQPIPIVGDGLTPYSVEIVWQRTAATGKPRVDVEWLDASEAVVATTTLQPQTAAIPQFRDVPAGVSGVWFTSRADGLLPTPIILTTARFARLVVRGSTLEAFNAIRVDRVGFYRTARELVTFVINNYSTPDFGSGEWKATRWISPSFPSPITGRYDWGIQAFDSGASPNGPSAIPETGEAIGVNFGSGFFAREDMTVLVDTIITVGSQQPGGGGGAGPARQVSIRLVKNATYGVNHENTGGVVVAQAPYSQTVISSSLGNPAIPSPRAAQLMLSARVALRRTDRLTVEFFRPALATSPVGDIGGTLNHLSVKQELAQ